ncbi:MAG: 30S ribosomal protein S16 [Planctomycetota bacterium]
MSVKIRMTRMGRRHRPFFRINAVESKTPRDGRILEKLGHYDPLEKTDDKQIVINKERIEFWIGQGAVASDTCAEIFKKYDIVCPQYEAKQKRRAHAKALARKQGKPFNEAERIAAAKAAEAAAKAAEEAAKAAEEAAAAKAAEEAAAAKAAEEAAAAEAEEAKDE